LLKAQPAAHVPLQIHHKLVVPKTHTLRRLDQSVSLLLPQYSRARLQQWIKAGDLTVDGKPAKSKDRLIGGEKVQVSVFEEDNDDRAEDIPLDVVFEDEHLLVINKAPGLVVHPGAGNPSGTLLNALLHHEAGLASIPRAGIVHRLDKETSGLMVVAKTLETQNHIVKEIQARTVSRIYDALVYGLVNPRQGRVDRAIGRHPIHRKKMAIRRDGKEARTNYRVLEQFDEHALVECQLDTGRTHQIRVHLQSLGNPLIGDPTYGGHYRRPRSGDKWLSDTLGDFKRQALHAKKLSLQHPFTGKKMTWTVKPPEDFTELLDLLHG
jgi:23S rRNA pseudouridine1911/1915/1917 synthase